MESEIILYQPEDGQTKGHSQIQRVVASGGNYVTNKMKTREAS